MREEIFKLFKNAAEINSNYITISDENSLMFKLKKEGNKEKIMEYYKVIRELEAEGLIIREKGSIKTEGYSLTELGKEELEKY